MHQDGFGMRGHPIFATEQRLTYSGGDGTHAAVRIGGGSAGVGAHPADGTDPSELDRVAQAAVLGDHDALHELWHANRRWVAAILLAHKPRWADVEDLLQEVAVSLVRKVGEVRDPRAVRPWLRTVAINVAHAAARSGRRRQGDERLSLLDSAEDTREGKSRDHVAAPTSLSDHEQGRILMELASQLPDGYREPLLLKALHDLSYREIGEILDLPETTIETRIARGRRQLRELAAKREEDESRRGTAGTLA